jgi:crotonobetainyl-CoA:carnitine CoA-transferase CaiB-like acyl-CoA transferase
VADSGASERDTAGGPSDAIQLHHISDTGVEPEFFWRAAARKLMALPLEGVKVLDFTAIMAGPYCTLMLADMGAEVTKIESFPEGDGTRRFDPKVNGESYCFAVLNRNKRSVALNLKDARGKDVFMKLARDADIVIENYRPGVARKLGVEYDTIKSINPDVIYASISGFGQTGPYSRKGGFDIIAQGMSGIMTMTGEPGGRPAKVGIAMNDIAAGTTALYSILGAYIKRLKTGEGVYLETSLMEAGMAWTFWEFGAYFGGGEVPIATGTRHRRSTPYQAYRTQDAYVTVGANNEKLWSAFCNEVLERPGLMQDARFKTLAARLKNIDALQDEIEKVFATQPTEHWVKKLDAAGVPGGPVFNYVQAFDNEHSRARNMVAEIEHPKIGRMKILGNPVKASAELARSRTPAPWLGQHSAEVLKGLGYNDKQVASLFTEGVVYDKYREAVPAK